MGTVPGTGGPRQSVGVGRRSVAWIVGLMGAVALLAVGGPAVCAPPDPWVSPEPDLPLQTVTPLGFTVFRSEFNRIFAPLEGEPYREPLMRKAVTAIVAHYHDQGYVYANIDWDRDVDVDLLEGRDRGYYVRVRIHEGTINAIRVEGLTHTRDKVIVQQLLLREGKLYRKEDADESERILRARPYVGRVDVRSAPSVTKEGVDIVVFVEDLWSFVPNIRLVNGTDGSLVDSLTSGDIGFAVSLRDSNLLGTGQSWRASYQWLASDTLSSTGLRRTRRQSRIGAEFHEPNVFGSRWEMSARFQEPVYTDVTTWEYRLSHPLYSLRTRWAAELYATEQGILAQSYYGGRLLREWEQRLQAQSVAATQSFGGPYNQLRLSFWISHRKRDWSLRYSSVELRPDPSFLAVPKGEERFEYSPVAVGPDQQALVGSTFTWHQVRYAEARNLDRLGRIEDIAVGNTAGVSLGVGRRELGNDHDEIVPSLALNVMRWTEETVYWHLGGSLSASYVLRNGRGGPTGFEDVSAALRGRALYRVGVGRTVAARVSALETHSTTGDFSIRLDDDTGVRGYERPGLDGRHRLVMNLEARQLLAQGSALVLAGVAFYDHGYAWWRGLSMGPAVRSVGVGFRLAILGISDSPILRGDLAFTLDSDPRAWEFSFGTGQYF